MALSNNFSRGNKNSFNYTSTEPYNDDGAIIFTKDTNELFINVGKINGNNTSTNRRQVNALYATAIKDPSSNTIYNSATIQALKDNLDNLIDNGPYLAKTNPTGIGTLSITPLEASESVAMLGIGLKATGLQYPTTVLGKYNVASTSDIFVVGNGVSDSQRSNALALSGIGTLVVGGSVYSNGVANTNNKLITQLELNNTVNTLNNSITNAGGIIVQSTAPAITTNTRNKLWINTSKGNGVINYVKNNAWTEVSAIFT